MLFFSRVKHVNPNQVRNSEIYKLVQDGILKKSNSVKAKLPSGRKITVKLNDDGTITKSFVNAKGHSIKANFEVVDNGARLRDIDETTSIGGISHVFTKDGQRGGHIWTNTPNPWDGLCWGYRGNVNNPTAASTCVHKAPYKNEESIDAFKAAVNYIRGNGSIDAYKAQMAK